jgi:multicomponent Na+:H+ antiporter subunit G
MTLTQLADAVSAVLLLLGALLALVAAIGILRLPDLLSRMHAATKPQVLGLWLVLIGLAFRLRDPGWIGFLLLIGLCQLLTTPVANHMLGRASLRAGQVKREHLVVDELDNALPAGEEPRGAP